MSEATQSALTDEDREALTVLLEQKADHLTEYEVDFLHGIRLRQALTPKQRALFEDLWLTIMRGHRPEREEA